MLSSVETEEFLARLGAVREQVAKRSGTAKGADRATEFLSRLEARLKRPPRIAIVGEVNSGKTTLANALIGRDLLTTDVVRNTRAPVLLAHSLTPDVHVRRADGVRERLEVGNVAKLRLGERDLIEVGIPLAALQDHEVIDTPGLNFSEPVIARTTDVCRLANLVVWCTVATQAWRASEIGLWSSVAKQMRRPGVLAVTNADALTEADRAKVRRRLEREAGPFFTSIVFTSATVSDLHDGTATGPLAELRLIAAGLQSKRCRRAAEVVRRFSDRIADVESKERPRRFRQLPSEHRTALPA